MKLMFVSPVMRDAMQATAQSSTWGTRSPSETRFGRSDHAHPLPTLRLKLGFLISNLAFL
jgi:hypothetical protein